MCNRAKKKSKVLKVNTFKAHNYGWYLAVIVNIIIFPNIVDGIAYSCSKPQIQGDHCDNSTDSKENKNGPKTARNKNTRLSHSNFGKPYIMSSSLTSSNCLICKHCRYDKNTWSISLLQYMLTKLHAVQFPRM